MAGAHIRKIPAAPEEQKRSANHISSLEHRVAGWLKQMRVAYRQQAPLDSYLVDFLIARPGQPDLVVEVNGCSVHGCAWCHCRPAWRGQKQRDLKKYAFLLQRGYDVLILGECQIEDHTEEAMERLAAACLVRPARIMEKIA